MDLIIGSGISGLSYANFTSNDYLIVEMEAEPGGYCRTIKKNGFVWDYSGHFFHFQHRDVQTYLCKNIKPENLLNIEKHSQIYYNGQYVDFPFQRNIHQLPKSEFIDCLYDLYQTTKIKKKSVTFKDMVCNELGQSISNKFLIPYNEKLYACNLDALDVDAMRRFFPKATFDEILSNFKQQDTTSYNSYFTYPKEGAEEYVKSLVKNIDSAKILLNEKVLKLDLVHKIAFTDKQEIKYDNLISTIPFPDLLNISEISFDENIFTSNKVLVFNLGFDKPSLDNYNSWIYFPSKEILFYRLGYYNNIIGGDRMSLYIEIGFNKKEKLTSLGNYLKRTISDLKKVGIITDHELIDYEAIMMDPAYVHINQKSLKACAKFKKKLAQYNVYSIGRYGSWTYCSIEDNIIEARELVNTLC